MMRKIVFSAVVILLGMLSVSCSSTPHENFKNFMQNDIGKSADDPNVLIVRYSEDIVNNKILPNGNTEVEFLIRVSPPYKESCTAFFEIDKTTNIIINWRYEGSEEGCVIMP